jgi:hypothetical protein
VHQLRLTCSLFYVDVRLREFDGRWLASADTPDGPTLGYGPTPTEALCAALEPFDGLIDELLASAQEDWLVAPSSPRSQGSC